LAKEAGPDFSKLQGKLLDYKNDIVQELEADQSIAPIIDGM